MSVSADSVKSIFLAAVDTTPAERTAFLDGACAGDLGLRARIEALLAAHLAPDPLLDRPAAEHLGEPVPAAPAESDLGFLSPPSRPGAIGRLDHYDVLEVIGRGGMGIVLRAVDDKLQRVVAIKALAPALAASGAARQRFVREARAAAAITHDHVIAIYAVEEAGPVPYLVMQCVDGKTLQDKLDAGGPLALVEILRVGVQVADGLAAAHRHGLVHRDVKPANILLENGVERVKLSDFGLARTVDDASLTQSGVIAGTPHYMSPEQANGERVDQRSDLFSLGSVLYAVCCGHPPFRAATPMGVLKRVAEEPARPVREINPAVPGWLEDLIDRLMAKDPADRIQAAAEVASFLGDRLAEYQGHAPRPFVRLSGRPPRRRRSGRRLAAAVSIALALVVAAGLVVRPTARDGRAGAGGEVANGATPPPADGDSPKADDAPPARAFILPSAARFEPVPLPDPAALAARPAAADALDAKNIPPALLAAATGGDPKKAPPGLVAVLADGVPKPDANVFCQLFALAFSPNGQFLVTGGWDKSFRVWDVATATLLKELTPRDPANSYEAYALAFSPDGKFLATGERPGRVRLWDAETWTEVRTITDHGVRLNHIAFSPDGKLLAVARVAGAVDLWDVPGGTRHRDLATGSDDVWCLTFSPDGALLATGTGKVGRLWDTRTWEPAGATWRHWGDVRWLGFSPDGRYLISSPTVPGPTPNQALRVWDRSRMWPRCSLDGHPSTVLSGAWRADGKMVATAGEVDGTVRLWDPFADPPVSTVLNVVPPLHKWLHAIALSPEGRYVAVTHPGGMVLIVRLANRGDVFVPGKSPD